MSQPFSLAYELRAKVVFYNLSLSDTDANYFPLTTTRIPKDIKFNLPLLVYKIITIQVLVLIRLILQRKLTTGTTQDLKFYPYILSPKIFDAT